MKYKTLAVIISIVALLIISALASYHFIFVIPRDEIAEKCQGYEVNWSTFVDCQGVMVINDAWDVNYLSIKDHVHDYSIAHVYNRNQYVLTEGKLFVINRKYIENSTSDGIETTYYQTLFQNGKMVGHPYSAISEIPVYLSVDTQTGEVNAYSNIDDAPKNDQKYFFEIETEGE